MYGQEAAPTPMAARDRRTRATGTKRDAIAISVLGEAVGVADQ